MNRYKIYTQLILLTMLLSCTFPTMNAKPAVTLSHTSDFLIIQNETLNKIYIFAVESGFVALIDWEPTFSKPSINGGKSLKINFKDISNGNSAPVKKGDRIIVYLWTDNYKTTKKVYNESIIL